MRIRWDRQMLLANGLLDLGIAFLLAVALAEWAKVRRKSERGFNWLATAGIWFLFAGTFAQLPSAIGVYLTPLFLAEIFSGVAWIFAILGTLFVGYETLLEK